MIQPSSLSPEDTELFNCARDVLHGSGREGRNSVGAAVRTSGGIYVGLDLMSRKSPICAEPGAISAAQSAGSYTLEAIIAVCLRTDISEYLAISPCGACRELINFHAPNCRVIFEYEGSWINAPAKELFQYPMIFG